MRNTWGLFCGKIRNHICGLVEVSSAFTESATIGHGQQVGPQLVGGPPVNIPVYSNGTTTGEGRAGGNEVTFLRYRNG